MDFLLDIKTAMLPEAIITFTILVCTVLCFMLKQEKQKIIYLISLLGLIISLTSINLLAANKIFTGFYNSFTSDFFSILMRFLILSGTLLVIIMTKDYSSKFKNRQGEFYLLMLIAALGALLLSGANDLIMIFVALEALSLSSYALSGFLKKDKSSNEAALKYLIFGGASSAIMLYGFSFLYGITGHTNLTEIFTYLANNNTDTMLNFTFFLIIAGFLFKVAAFPFQSWAPDVYEGAPVPVTAFLSTVSKVAGFAILIKFIGLAFNNVEIITVTLGLIALLSITIGNFMALNQMNIKRLMAYSSISQAGFVLIGFALLSYSGISGAIFYLISYLVASLGAWLAIIIFNTQTNKSLISDLNGIAYRNPYFATCFAFCLLSLAGIPVTVGFMAKFYLFHAIVQEGPAYLWLLILALLNTILSLFYYLKIIKAMFVCKQENESFKLNFDAGILNTSLVALTLVVVLLGVLVTPFIEIARDSALSIKLPVKQVGLSR